MFEEIVVNLQYYWKMVVIMVVHKQRKIPIKYI